jgi:hypothetical protein
VSDPRSHRVAVVADSLLDAKIDKLGSEGFGLIQLPPAGLDRETTSAWLDQTAEHVAEFLRNDYEVVLVDDGLHTGGLNAALAELGVEPLPQYSVPSQSTSTSTPET